VDGEAVARQSQEGFALGLKPSRELGCGYAALEGPLFHEVVKCEKITKIFFPISRIILV